jgi:hypothetical protein
VTSGSLLGAPDGWLEYHRQPIALPRQRA